MSGMFALLFQAAKHVHHAAVPIKEAAQQVIQVNPPPVYVTVPQPPAGMPEWVKILISGAVGMIFGMISSIFLEWWKANKERKAITNEARGSVTSELRENLNLLNSHLRYLTSPDQKTSKDDDNAITARTWSTLQEMTRDRFNYYFSEHKSVLYGLDPNKHLTSFYKDVDRMLWFANLRKSMGVIASTHTARTHGVEFLKENGIEYKAEATLVDKMDELKAKGIWPGATGTTGS
jgi:hypothetical protein